LLKESERFLHNSIKAAFVRREGVKMDKSDKTVSRRDFIRVVGGALVATELGVAGCADKNSSASEIGSDSGGGVSGSQNANTGGSSAGAASGLSAQGAGTGGNGPSGVGAGGNGGHKSAVTGGSGGSKNQPSAGAKAGSAGSSSKLDAGAVDNGKSKVYIVKTDDRKTGISQVLAMAGGLGFASGRDVVLKPNFNSTYPPPATTHDDTIRTIVDKLKAAKAGNIILGESSGSTTGGAAPTQTVAQAKGTLDLCSALGIDFVSFDDPSVEYETFQFDGMTWSGGLAIPKLMRSDRVKILMPCCKTHALGGYTFSLKLAVGLVPRSRRQLEMHIDILRKIADINMGFKPDLIVMDAMLCFTSGGPDTGITAAPGLILAAKDRVAMDAVAVAVLKSAGAIIGGKIFDTGQIARAVDIGLGATSPDDIELIGEDTATISNLRSILDNG
jgi:uncharacterized protein (DUF362 family)